MKEKILNWLKQHKWKVILPAGVLLLLAAAFWYGSGTPGTQGFQTGGPVAMSGEAVSSGAIANAKNSEERQSVDSLQSKATGNGLDVAEGEASASSADKENPSKSSQKNDESSNDITSNDITGGEDKATTDSTEKQSPQGTKGNGGAGSGVSVSSGNSSAVAGSSGSSANSSGSSGSSGNSSGSSGASGDGKDKYQTEPVPEGKPEPMEPQDVVVESTSFKCTLSISCATILNNMDLCDPGKVGLIPKDGWILKPQTVTFKKGESVFDVLQRVCKEKKIHMEFSKTPMYNSAYIEGIANIYEFDVGSLSGWEYQVNGWFPNYGCSRYQLKDGDVINWLYTCDLGKDIGGSNTNGG